MARPQPGEARSQGGQHSRRPACELEHLQPRRRAFPALETAVVRRALAIILVVAAHIGLFSILGGAHLLLIFAGRSFARFALADVGAGTSRRILRSATRFAVPAMLWLALPVPFTGDVGVANVLLVNNYLQTSPAWGYWFIEVLVQMLLVLAIPAVQRLERRHGLPSPWAPWPAR